MATRYSDPFTRYLTDNIASLPGGQLFFYETGSVTTLKATFSDSAGAIANANPVILDGSGRVPDIFLEGTYRVVLWDKDGVLQDEADPVGGDTSGGAFSDWNATVSYGINDTVTGSDGCRYQSLVADNLNNDPANEANPLQWEKVLFTGVWNPNITYVINDNVRASNGRNYRLTSATSLNQDPTTDGGVNWVTPLNLAQVTATVLSY